MHLAPVEEFQASFETTTFKRIQDFLEEDSWVTEKMSQLGSLVVGLLLNADPWSKDKW